MAMKKQVVRVTGGLMILAVALMVAAISARAQQGQFRVEESSISDVHRAIRAGRTSCHAVVQAYIARAKAYNGVCTALVTKDGAPIPPSTGMIRAGAPIMYPTKTVAASTVFPNIEQYNGVPFEYGRMEQSISDSSVQLQMGMRVGIPNAGQLNALETLNIRGERSVTCKGDFDRAPSAGPLPPSAPVVCEEFRKQPDALERAAELDQKYGSNPDLTEMPDYCAVVSLKGFYDAKDMRATGGNDVNFAMDVPKVDSPDVAVLRSKGAIIFAVSATATASPDHRVAPFGPSKANSIFPDGQSSVCAVERPAVQSIRHSASAARNEQWVRRFRSGQSGGLFDLRTNCGILQRSCVQKQCGQSPDDEGHPHGRRVVQQGPWGPRRNPCCTITSATRCCCWMLSKVSNPDDIFTDHSQEASFPSEPYSSFLVPDSAVATKPLKGLRVGIIREFMVKHTKNDVAISDQIDQEIKMVLRDKLGAELVESVDPLYPDDPSVPDMKYTFQDALSEILPASAPEYFWQTTNTGELEFAVPGWDVRTVDYDVALSLHKAPLSDKINLRSITTGQQTIQLLRKTYSA